MQVIYKYQLPTYISTYTVDLPEGAKFLKFAYQNDEPTVWFLVNPDAKFETRSFEMYGTGWEIQNPERI